MGAVFRALDTMLNREVALKVLSRDQGADDETRRRFQNEAQSAARLDHENIARVYYVGEDRGLNYIVFEFIEGINLRDLVGQKGPLPLPEALSYTLQMAHALAHASGRDVVHRDIKPSNVIITGGGRAKLVDMGLARLHQVHPDGDLTASGVTLGTFDYISPEQARDPRCADVRSDLYSLGCTLYYMLTGRPPFPDGTVLQKLLQHNSDAPPDPREFDPSLPPAISTLVSKMLAKDPLRRYQAPSELVADLLQVAEQFGCALPGVDRPNWLPALESKSASASLARHLPWLVPISLLLVSVVAAAWPIPWIDSSNDVTAILAARLQRPQRARSAGGDGRELGRSDEEDEAENEGGKRSAPRTGVESGPSSPPSNDTTAATSASARSTDRADSPTMPNAGEVAATDGAKGNAPSKGTTASKGTTDSVEPAPATTASKSFDEDYLEFSRPPAEATTVPSVPAAEPIPDGLLVVGSGAKDPRRYASLAEACAAAKNNDVVELRYDGGRDELPIVLHNQRIEIRSGAQWRPRVVFNPDDTTIATDRSMITISGGNLKLTGVEIELDLSAAAPSENWSLFSIDQADSLRLEHCLLTVRNATSMGSTYHDKVSFFSLGSSAAAEPMVMMPKGMLALPPVQLDLNNCLVRGEADLLVDRDLRPLNFSCVNGLVAVSERFFVAGEGASMPQEGARVRIVLDRVTALARQGLCRVAASDAAPSLPEVEMRLSGCEILSDLSDAPLIEHISNKTASELQSVFHWDASDTVYRGIRTFWKIAPTGVSREMPTKTYREWTNLWPAERNTRAEPLAWHLSPPRRPLHTVTPADFRLASSQPASQDMEATGGASRSTGADFDLLFDLLPQSAIADQ